MSVVTGALGSLAPKLLQLLHDEYKLQKGVRKQVQWLHSELESIHAFLREVSDVPWDRLNEQVKVWAREVREASYDMEDVLDTFLVRVDGGDPADPSRLKHVMKKMCKVFSKAKVRRGIAGAIEDIKKHLEEIAERRQKYKLDEMIMSKPITSTSAIDPRLTAMYKEVSQLIGVDKSRDELISMLNHRSQPDDDAPYKKIIKRVSIVGVGGLGKTTLAKAAYDKLKSQYDCGAFVSVGQDHDLVKVFKDILFDLDKKKYEDIHNTGRGADLLIREIREFLENKRYFIVIDDVWEVRTWEAIKLFYNYFQPRFLVRKILKQQNTIYRYFLVVDDVWDVQTWKRIKPVLVENDCGSKVITTTRKLHVGEEAGDVYKLKPLSKDDSMKLFYTRIFGADEKYDDNQMDDISKKFLKKCGGIPLAIITMTSLLVRKQKHEWSEVYNSIGFGSKGNTEVEDTMTIISFSYYDLPPHLRTCLLYLCTYPEDYEIRKDTLIWKWIAEGFINKEQGTRLFEVGEGYFNELINRSLIQPVDSDWDGIVQNCRVHDVVLELTRKLSYEENFIAILDDNVEGRPALSSNVRRLAHQKSIAEDNNNSEAIMVTAMPKVRSYTAFKCSIDSQDQFLRFKLLRVLDIVKYKYKEGCHLEHLGDLLYLRYLGIRLWNSNDRLELPKQIGNLKLLQTLDLHGILLPASIVKLTQLVRVDAYNSKAPNGIGNLTSLEELGIYIGGNSESERFMKELGSLRELRVLSFSSDGMDESTQRHFLESLRNLKKIQHIYVDGYVSYADTAVWEAAGFVLPRSLCYLNLSTRFSKLPSCINPSRLPNLSNLTLQVTTMDEHDLKLLGRLPVLCHLSLCTESTVTACSINGGDCWFFQNLKYFGTSAMVQFEQQHNEGQTNISFHMWNGEGDMPFGSRKNDSNKAAPSVVMPNVEILGFWVYLRALKVNNGDCRNIGLEYLPSLQQVRGWYCHDGMSAEEVDAALDVPRDECKAHPNNPTLKMDRSAWDELKEREVSQKANEKDQEEANDISHTADVDVSKLSLSSP